MNKNIRIIDECGYNNWAKALVKDVLCRANIQTEEITIWDMTHKRIEFNAEVWDETLPPDEEGGAPGSWVDKHYTVKFYEENVNPVFMLLSFEFYDNERTLVEQVRKDGSSYQVDTPTYLDRGAYRIFAYWATPICVRIED